MLSKSPDLLQLVVIAAIVMACAGGLAIALLKPARRSRQSAQQVTLDVLAREDREDDDANEPTPEPAAAAPRDRESITSAIEFPELSRLSDPEKHRVIYKFVPTLRGHLLSGDDLEAHFADAIRSGLRHGWSQRELASAAKSNTWKRSPSEGDR